MSAPPPDTNNPGDFDRTRETAATGPATPETGGQRFRIPKHIGQYTIIRLLGVGGMGAVYEAQQERPQRKVALKVIRSGVADSDTVRRFEAEANLLARLQHPGIAQVYDAGTMDRPGREKLPFFAMELIRGVPLNVFAETRKLSTHARLAIMIKICQAVQHAHAKGIIHRDLKPGNILVDETGQPKILDFGVARLTSSDVQLTTMRTDIGQLIGTVPYMSPEQAAGDPLDLDTRSDVYALGVICYELLAGRLPYDLRKKLIHEAVRIIREDEPAPLSSINTVFRGDVETIVAKALEKDKARRYQTAAELAADFAHYLSNEPIVARPATVGYQLKKFSQRNKALVAGTIATFVSLVLGLAGTLWYAAQASQQATAARIAEGEQKRLAADESAARLVAEAQTKIANTKTAEAEKSRQLALVEAYAANLDAADASLIAKEPSRVRVRLDACAPAMRGWEWRWLKAASDDSLTIMSGHRSLIRTMAYSHDGTRILSASDDGTIRIWDAKGNPITTLQVASSIPIMAALSPDGKRVAAVCGDQTVRIWDVATGQQLRSLQGHTAMLYQVGFSPDGQRLFTTSEDRTVRIWQCDSGLELATIPGHGIDAKSATFSQDGKQLLVCGAHYVSDGEFPESTATLHDATTGKPLLAYRGHKARVYMASFSPDGTSVLTVSEDKTARIWQAATGKELTVLQGHEQPISAFAFSPDGTRLVTTSADKTLRTWDPATGRCLSVVNGPPELRGPVTFSADLSRLLTITNDGQVHALDARSCQPFTSLRGHEGRATVALFTPDGAGVLTAGDISLRLWEIGDGKDRTTLRGHEGWITKAAMNRDGTRLATVSSDATARVWDLRAGRQLAVLRGHEGQVATVAMDPECKRIATVGYDSSTRLWDAVSGKQIARLKGHYQRVNAMVFSPDGLRLATASTDTTARVWDPQRGTELTVLQGHKAPVWGIAFSPDGKRLVTASDDRTARVWDVNGQMLATMSGHEDAVLSAVFSPDGSRVLTTSKDHTARLWYADSGSEIAVMRGHEGTIASAAFSPDGSRLLTKSGDRVRICDAQNGNEIAVIPLPMSGIYGAAFSPDGARIVTALGDGARLWDAITGRELAVLRGHSQLVSFAGFTPDGSRIVTTSLDRTVRVWESQPLRERIAGLAKVRAAETRMGLRVKAALDKSQSPDEVEAQLGADRALTVEERSALQAELCAAREAAVKAQ